MKLEIKELSESGMHVQFLHFAIGYQQNNTDRYDSSATVTKLHNQTL